MPGRSMKYDVRSVGYVRSPSPTLTSSEATRLVQVVQRSTVCLPSHLVKYRREIGKQEPDSRKERDPRPGPAPGKRKIDEDHNDAVCDAEHSGLESKPTLAGPAHVVDEAHQSRFTYQVEPVE